MQTKFWLPWNSVSNEIFYNQRVILSMPMDVPITWQISKVENTTPRGVVQLTLYQDTFNPKTDYVDKSDPDHWRMYADFFKFPATPEADDSESQEPIMPLGSVVVSSTTALFKIGGGYKTLTATYFTEEGAEIPAQSYSWSFRMDDGTEAEVETKPGATDNKIKVKFLGDDSYVGRRIIATCTATVEDSEVQGEESFDIIFM
jgi:hypothetical protein